MFPVQQLFHRAQLPQPRIVIAVLGSYVSP
jgi:hypothetical protein